MDEFKKLEKRIERMEDMLQLMIRNLPTPVQVAQVTSADPREFTQKQHAVIQLVYHGFGTDDMAEVLGVADGTIKVHIRSIMRKQGFRSRHQLAGLYEEWLEAYPADQYERLSGVPMGWGEDPKSEAHTQVTKQLRIKLR